jgi:mannose-1-phosphate guanylyltransferase / phosphomannomutase
MQAVIMAGGTGPNMHSLTADASKPMTPVFSRPVMDHLIEHLAKHDIRDIIVVTSYFGRDIVDYFGDGSKWAVNIRYSIEETPKGTAGGVKDLQPVLGDTFLVISGDTITDFDLDAAVDYHRSKSALATIVTHEVDDPTEYGVVAMSNDGLVTRFLEKPKSYEVFSKTVSTGIYVLEPEALSSIPYDTPYDFGRELFPRLLRNMEPIYGVSLPGYWCDMGSFAQYRKVHFDALTSKVSMNITGTQVQEGVWLGEDCEVHPTVRLSAPLFVGNGAEVRRNVDMGGLTVVGDETLVDEGASLLRSIVGSGAIIGRSSKVRDCVIGSGYHLSDHGDVHNRIVTMTADRTIPGDWDEDIPSISIGSNAMIAA